MKNKTMVNYVEVQDEPFHKEKFNNQLVRIYLVSIPPGEQTLYHRHGVNTVYVVFKGGSIKNQPANKKEKYPIHFPKSFNFFGKMKMGIGILLTGSVMLPNGFFFCMFHQQQPVIHQAAVSKNNFSNMLMMGIEIKEKRHSYTRESLINKYFQEDFDHESFSIYRMRLPAGQSTDLFKINAPWVIIGLKGSAQLNLNGTSFCKNNGFKLVPGDFQWHEGNSMLDINNSSNEACEAFLIVLK